jgi:hypothetical protein
MRNMGKGELLIAHAIKVYGGAGVKLCSFLTLAPDGLCGQLHTCGHFTQEKEFLVPTEQETKGPQRQSGNFGEEEIIFPLLAINP